MKITRENYEAYFLDFIEGTLAPQMAEQLHIFLEENPDLANELEEVRASMDEGPQPDKEFFDFKDALKKKDLPISSEDLNLLLARELEGDVDAAEIALLRKLETEYPVINKERTAFAKTRLNKEEIRFTGKQGLQYNDAPDLGDVAMLMAAAGEKDLNSAEKARLEGLLADPVMRHTYEMMMRAKLHAGDTIYAHKSSMRFPASVDMQQDENLLIAKVEGDLSYEENERLSALLASNDHLRSELSLFYRTKLKAEELVFEGKNDLRKKETVILPIRRMVAVVSAAAAVVAIIFWLNNYSTEPAHMASTDERPVENVPHERQVDHNPTIQPRQDAGNTPHPSKNIIIPRPQNDVAIGNDPVQDEHNDTRPSLPPLNKMRSMSHGELDMASHRKVVVKAPAMQIIYEPLKQNETITEPESITMLAYLGQVAEERLEGTYAYAFAEKQIGRIYAKTREEVKVERVETKGAEELRLRVGKIGYSKSIQPKKEGDKSDRLTKLEKIYNAITK